MLHSINILPYHVLLILYPVRMYIIFAKLFIGSSLLFPLPRLKKESSHTLLARSFPLFLSALCSIFHLKSPSPNFMFSSLLRSPAAFFLHKPISISPLPYLNPNPPRPLPFPRLFSSSPARRRRRRSPSMSSSSGRTVSDVLMGAARARAAASKRSKSNASPATTAADSSAQPPPPTAEAADVIVGTAHARAAASKRSNSNTSPGTTAADPPSQPPPTTDAAAPPPPPSPPAKKLRTVGKNQGDKKEVKRKLDASLELRKRGSEFDPRAAAFWQDGESVPFLFLARALELISAESGRIAITDILCNVFRTVIATTPRDLLATVYLSANRIAPPHEGIELGIGDAALVKSLADAYGSKEDQVRKRLKDLGDLGLVAKTSRSSMRMLFKKPDPLTIPKVLDTFRTIAKESGKDSQEKKRNHIKGLLVAATDCEPQYIVRLLQSKMRIGLAEKTVLMALGQAAVYSEAETSHSQNQSAIEEASNIMKQVYSVLPIYDKIVPALLDVGIWNLPESCKFSLGVPVGPMLAKPTKSVSEILDKFQGVEFTCEYKYDGERAQIHHMEDGSVEIYSRNAERNTGKYPDVVDSVPRFKKPDVKSFVLDCEIVAYDTEKQKILPFQVLSNRARKDVTISDIKVAVCTFAFDILYINGQPLLQEQLKVRREHLYNSFVEVPGIFQFATARTSNELEEMQKFLDAAVNSSCEGLIIKTLDKEATYEPSKRSNNWLKLKKDYMESVGDSFDLVPVAAFHGRGKRTGVYGAFLLACYDENKEEYQSICKIGTGFSESQLEERSSNLRNKVIPKPKPYYQYSDTMNPDVWFEPAEVWEVKAADLSISPVHRAANGIVDPNKGISLRFPRLLRVRDDKHPEEATTSEQVADMYRAQKFNHTNNQEDDDE